MISRLPETARDDQALLASVLDNTDNAILALDADDRVVFFNERYLELWHDDAAYLATGPTVYELIRRACREGIYADGAAEALIAARRADLARCGKSRIPLHTPRQDGVEIEAYAVALPGGGHLLSYRDVTDRRRADEALRASEARYRALVEASPDAVLVHLADGILLANPAARALFGARGDEELLGRSYLEFVAPADREAVARRRRALLEGGRALPPAEQRIVRLDRRVVDVEAASVPFAYQGKPAALTILRDITERKQAQQELARLAAAVEQAAEVIVVTDARGVIEYLNPAFERQSGWKRADFVGRPAADLAAAFSAHAAETVRRAMSRPEPWVGRLRGRTRSGAECELESTISPVFDARGALINFVGVHHDVTRQVRLEEQMRQAQKLEAIGTLAGGIAHDFNNILAAILGYAELAWESIPAGSRARDDLGHVIHAAVRARDLIRQILSFSQPQEQERAPVDLASLVEEALPLLRASLPSRVAIEVAPGSARPVVLADPVQLHQVLLNLGANAGHAMGEGGGTLRVELEAVDVPPGPAAGPTRLSPGAHARLSVSDTGCGIPEELLDRIFEPFFTTKGVGEGTGLGLAVVHGVVRAHGGEVTVESATGRGTTFRVYLPAAPEPPRRGEPPGRGRGLREDGPPLSP